MNSEQIARRIGRVRTCRGSGDAARQMGGRYLHTLGQVKVDLRNRTGGYAKFLRRGGRVFQRVRNTGGDHQIVSIEVRFQVKEIGQLRHLRAPLAGRIHREHQLALFAHQGPRFPVAARPVLESALGGFDRRGGGDRAGG